MSFFAKALMPIATSIFRKAVPAGIGGIRSFFSKAPSLQSFSSGLGNVSRIGNQIVGSPVADALASQLGAGKSLAIARQGLKGVESANNILEKVRATQPMKQQQAVVMPPRMPDVFGGNLPPVVGRGYEGFN